jgi:eukaryotic-like serine/threonine-protein kinase
VPIELAAPQQLVVFDASVWAGRRYAGRILLCAEVAAGLAAAHEIGLVHRDVSPANILMSRTRAKVVDFGISAVAGARESKAPVLGTPAYLAPERLSGTPAVPATDVYALGVLLFQALTGSLPWTAGRRRRSR